MSLSNLRKSLSYEQPPSLLAFPPSIGLVHFVGIGGHGVSGLALILHKIGYTVQGSDAKESDNINRLRAAVVTVFIGHDEAYVNSAKLVVASAAAWIVKFRPRDNIQVKLAREKGIPMIHRAELLAELMRNKKAIAVGGSHGKSTTTSIIGGILEAGGLNPTVVTGAIMNLYDSNSHLGSGEWVVAEADESDGSFLCLPHLITVVTNIDSDHFIYWKDQTKTRAAFTRFVRNMPFYGLRVICIDDPGVRQILPLLQDRDIITYGISEDADFCAEKICSMPSPETQSQRRIGPISIKALGIENVRNTLAAIVVSTDLGIGIENLNQSLSSFPGLHHRFQVVGSCSSCRDKCGDSDGQADGGPKIIAVNQPSARLKIVEGWLDEYPALFKGADHVIIGQGEGGNMAAATEGREMLVEYLRAYGREDVISMPDSNQLPRLISEKAGEGDIVICMGYLGSGRWAKELIQHLGEVKST
ncbi:uncharacterized protein N7483_011949 [Penicillium malachiteum]|uniref:uncharacterized protein n=1 Tax=Penicillium malachiteum TaxID=1324776 RepID=UPI002548417B|nr:uncharacterized protein N7483_011949 [Penicillium malachiteum]KAJ5714768.1 hypothetical protein N7483_011949 [Penicillium malachiteum]